MNDYYLQDRGEMLGFVPERNTSRVLDVGCGQGVFGKHLKDRQGAEVWGIEMMQEEATQANQRLDRVLVGTFDDAFPELPQGYYDCIVFNDVLEHMVDPYSVIVRAKALLNDGGVVVCSIPNIRYFPVMLDLIVKGDWKYEDSGVLDRTHLRFFTRKSIRRMFSENGYMEERMEGINPFRKKKLLGLFHFINTVTLGKLSDCRYQQFACVMKPKN